MPVKPEEKGTSLTHPPPPADGNSGYGFPPPNAPVDPFAAPAHPPAAPAHPPAAPAHPPQPPPPAPPQSFAAAPQYGQPGAHHPGPPPPPMPGGYPQGQPTVKVPSRKGPVFTLLAGVLSGIIGLAVFVGSAFVGLGSFAERMETQELLNSGQVYELTTAPNTMYGVFIAAAESIVCQSENEHGEPVEITVPAADMQFNERAQVLHVTTGAADTTIYLACETDNGSDYYFGATFDGGFRDVAGLTLTGGILLALGLVLFVGGFIWLLVRNSKIKQARLAALHNR